MSSLISLRLPAVVCQRLFEAQKTMGIVGETRNHFIARMLARGIGMAASEVPAGYMKDDPASWYSERKAQ